MTDYEKVLEEADDLIKGLRDPKIAHYAVGRAAHTIDDARDVVPRLAAALREVMAERDAGADVGARLIIERDTALATVGKIRCVVGKAGTDDDVLDAVRAALADVEAMRADWTRAVDDIAAFLESCDDSRDDPMAYAAMEVRRRWARATPNTKETK